ncbi:MAG TPA: TonB-dependent receptor [Sphingomicrobium sp.]|nr:TonB-dependent receptor [Sphingomicrobium sp.]
MNIAPGPEHDRCVVDARRIAGDTQARGENIVVTGTRINRPTLSSPVPVTSVALQDLSQGTVSLGDKLAELPQIRASFTQANSTRFIGTSGISALDLYGLGTARTLVLVNGRRIITATPGINRPDVNTVPIDLVDRVDIVTGGNSAIYGSDAVAGVVNFVLKRNFDGIKVNGQFGMSSRADRQTGYASVVAGRNFSDGRGNIAVAAEYAKEDTLYFTDRDAQTGAFSGRSQFNLTENTGPNLNPAAGPLHGPQPAAGDGIPDTSFLTDIRNNNISEGGLFTASCPTAPARGETVAAFTARRAAACSGLANPASSNPLAQFGRTFVFLPNGTLIANPCITDYRPFGSSNCMGGLGSTLRLTGMLEPGLTRKAINLLAHYDFSDALRPFVEANFVRVDANQEGQPTFFNNTFSINNPFLSPQAKAQLQAVLPPGVTTFTAQRFNTDFAGRGELHQRDNYQVVGGVDGTFNSNWKYEVSLTYGGLDTYYSTKGNILRANYANAINAVKNSAGQIVCGINADANPANDDPNCVPLNLFGQGAPSQAALNYIGYTSWRKQRANLYDGIAYMSGDSGQILNLPGGPISFVLGGEYRKETAFAAYDPVTSSTACGVSGCTFLNVIPDFRPPDLKVAEAFGEVDVPILKNLPFAQQLEVDGAARYSHYNIGKTRGVVAWNVSGIYAPVRDLKFRGGIARSVRAPTQSDLYSPATQTFVNNVVDPCGQQNINNGPVVNGQSVRIPNCAAAGVPKTQTFNGTTEPFTNRPASGIAGVNAGNPNLSAEQGTSFTLGGILQPRVLPGFSFAVDYFHIKVKQAIQALTGQQIINLCYDSTTGINNPYCAAVFRNPNGTFAGQNDVIHGGGTVSLSATGPSVLITSFNFAKFVTSGVNFDAAYRHGIGMGTTMTLRSIWSHYFKKDQYTNVTDPNFRTRQLSLLGDPAWEGQTSLNLEKGIFNLGYRARFIGKQLVAGSFDTFFSVQGRPPTSPEAFPVHWYPQTWIHDVRLDVNVGKKYRVYVGVDNVFDKLPPLDLLGTESGAVVSPVGRFLYLGATANF